MSNVAAGRLNTATAGAVTSTSNAVSRVWSASGAITNVNTLLAALTFTPTANFNGNFSIATSVSDGIAPPVTGTKSYTGVAVNDAPTGTVTITGTAAQNQTLTASNILIGLAGKDSYYLDNAGDVTTRGCQCWHRLGHCQCQLDFGVQRRKPHTCWQRGHQCDG